MIISLALLVLASGTPHGVAWTTAGRGRMSLMRRPRLRAACVAYLTFLVLLSCSSDAGGSMAWLGAGSQTPLTTAAGVEPEGEEAPQPQATGEPADRPGAEQTEMRRVLFVGDSLMFGAVPALDGALAAQGVETRYVGFAGTGLLSGQGWWNREISVQVDVWRPDVVVIEACCNYADGEPEYVDEMGRAVAPDSEQMYALWAMMAADAVRRAGAGGADVLWVTTPCVGSVVEWVHIRVARFNRIVDDLGVDRVDWAAVLCPGGAYTAALDIDGRVVQVRTDDGVHLTDDGDSVVAETTWRALSHRLSAS